VGTSSSLWNAIVVRGSVSSCGGGGFGISWMDDVLDLVDDIRHIDV